MKKGGDVANDRSGSNNPENDINSGGDSNSKGEKKVNKKKK